MPLSRAKLCTWWVLLALQSGCTGCPDPFAPPGVPVDRLYFPTGLALHPTQPILFVANSNGDVAFSGGAVLGAHLGWLIARLELEGRIPDPVVAPWQTAARTASLGGLLVSTPDGTQLLHVTKEDARLVQLDVEVTEESVRLSCGSAAGSIPNCGHGDQVLQLSGTDPHGLALQRVGTGYRVHVGDLRTGQVQGADFFPRRGGAERLVGSYVRPFGGKNKTGYLAILPAAGGFGELLLATGRDFPGDNLQIGTARYVDLSLDPTTAPVQPLDFFEQVGSVDIRGVAAARDGQTAYFISRVPPALLEVDMRRGLTGNPRGEVRRLAQLPNEPSVAALYDPPNGPRLLLAASFKDHLLIAVDLETLEVSGIIRDIGVNPFDIAVDARRGLAFVSCHSDDTVAVVRLPRGLEDQQFFLAARLGTPRDDSATNPELPSFLPAFNIPGNEGRAVFPVLR